MKWPQRSRLHSPNASHTLPPCTHAVVHQKAWLKYIQPQLWQNQKQATATLACHSIHKMASPSYSKGMSREHAPKQTLFSSVEYGKGEERETHVSGGRVGWRQGLRHTKPLEQDRRTGAHHRYLFGHHYGNNISRKKMKRIPLPTVRITESLHHRGPQYVHLTVTKFKRIQEKLNWK